MDTQKTFRDVSNGWFNEEFGQALREARGGLSQAALAKTVNRQAGHVSRVELGKTAVSLEEAVLLTKTLPLAFSVRDGICKVEISESPERATARREALDEIARDAYAAGLYDEAPSQCEPVERAARYAETGDPASCCCVGVCSVTGSTSCFSDDTTLVPLGSGDHVYAVSEPVEAPERNLWKRLRDWWVGTEYVVATGEPLPRNAAPPSDRAIS